MMTKERYTSSAALHLAPSSVMRCHHRPQAVDPVLSVPVPWRRRTRVSMKAGSSQTILNRELALGRAVVLRVITCCGRTWPLFCSLNVGPGWGGDDDCGVVQEAVQ